MIRFQMGDLKAFFFVQISFILLIPMFELQMQASRSTLRSDKY